MTDYEEVIHALKTWRREYAEEFGDTSSTDKAYIQGMGASIRIVESVAANQPPRKDYEAMYKRLKSEIESSLAVAEEESDQSDYRSGYHGAWADAAAFMYQIEENS